MVRDDRTELTRLAEAAVEAFQAGRAEDARRVTLRLVAGADQAEFLELASASAGLHHPWMSLPATPPEFRAYLARFDHVTAEGFLICLRGTGAIVGAMHRATAPAPPGRPAPAGQPRLPAARPAARLPERGLLPRSSVHRWRLAGRS